MNHAKCDTLLEASKALLRKSGLARWDDQTFAFVPMYPGNEDYEFEEHWKEEFRSRFGRYMAWVLFSVGAENLAKAACVCNKVVRGKTTSLIYPRYTELIPVDEWVDSVTNENRSHEDEDRATKHNYQPLEKYWKSHLPELRRRRKVCHEVGRRSSITWAAASAKVGMDGAGLRAASRTCRFSATGSRPSATAERLVWAMDRALARLTVG